jgi:hypothetical protein
MIQWWQEHWVGICAGYVLFIQVMKALRDAIDTSPSTDDNWFERACTIMSKLGASLMTGARPK